VTWPAGEPDADDVLLCQAGLLFLPHFLDLLTMTPEGVSFSAELNVTERRLSSLESRIAPVTVIDPPGPNVRPPVLGPEVNVNMPSETERDCPLLAVMELMGISLSSTDAPPPDQLIDPPGPRPKARDIATVVRAIGAEKNTSISATTVKSTFPFIVRSPLSVTGQLSAYP